MRSTLGIALVIGSTLLSSSAAVNAASIVASATPVPAEAPIGHLQPHGQQFSPRSPAEQSMQQQTARFDAEQQNLDQQFDERLNICRGC